MMGIWPRIIACCLIAAPISTCVSTPPVDVAAPQVYLMRHLHTDESPGDIALIAEGSRQARILAERLSDKRIAAIFVTDTSRSRATAAPLAAAIGVVPTQYDPRKPADLLARISEIEAPVLIVAHSNTAPQIAEMLGVDAGTAAQSAIFGIVLSVGTDAYAPIVLGPPR